MGWKDRWGLWGEDVHSGIGNTNFGTYLWASQIGFSDAQARLIAIANNATDNYAGWAVIAGVPGRHFDTSMGGPNDSRDIYARNDLELALRLYKKRDECGSLKALGRGLHSPKILSNLISFPRLNGVDFITGSLKTEVKGG